MIYAIGDIHGEFERLERLLKRIRDDGYSSSDQLVFIGDYIDRGPDSAAVLARLIEISKTEPNAVFLRGNHEDLMLSARSWFDSEFEYEKRPSSFEQATIWFANGGVETLASYPPGETSRWWKRVPDAHWQFLLDTEIEYWQGPYLFVHAGLLPPGISWEPDIEGADPRLWIRAPFIQSETDFGHTVVFGHTPQRTGRPLVQRNKIGIDTAVAYGGPMTAAVLDPALPYKPKNVRFLQV